MRLSPEQVAQICDDFEDWLSRADDVSTDFLARPYRTERGDEFARHALCRRLNMMQHAAIRIFEKLPPDIENPDRAQIMDAAAYLQVFMMNTYGAIDNLAHIWCAELPVISPSGQPLNRNDIGLRPKSKKVRASLPQDLQDYLDGHDEWFRYLEDYRDALAHRVPLYIPPRGLAPSEQEEHNRIASEWNDAVIARDWLKADRLLQELEEVGNFLPFFMHSFGERARPMLIHGQIVCDLATVVEISERMLAAL